MLNKYQILDTSGGVDFKAYSAVRSILRKRLERIVAKRPDDVRASSILQRLKTSYTVKGLKGMTEAGQKRAIEQVQGWLKAGGLSLKGIREQTLKSLKTLHEHGYTFLTEKDLDEWGRAAKAARELSRRRWMNYETALQTIYANRGMADPILSANDEREALEVFGMLIKKSG